MCTASAQLKWLILQGVCTLCTSEGSFYLFWKNIKMYNILYNFTFQDKLRGVFTQLAQRALSD